MKQQQCVILVLGMHRSGTSLASAIFEKLGVDFGPDLLGAMEGVNEKGFWEARRLVEAHEKLLHSLDRTWYDVTPLPDGWMTSEAAISFQEDMQAWLQETFSTTSLFCLKDPRMCLFMPLWHQILAALDIKVCCVIVGRNPLEIAHSLFKRDGLPPLYSLALTQYYRSTLWRDIADVDIYKLTFSDILKDWREGFSGLNEAFHLDLDIPALGDDAGGVLDVGLQHNKLESHTFDSIQHALDYYQSDMSAKDKAIPSQDLNYFVSLKTAWEKRHEERMKLQQKLQALGEDLSYARSIVEERDAELSSYKQLQERLGQFGLGRWLMRKASMQKDES